MGTHHINKDSISYLHISKKTIWVRRILRSMQILIGRYEQSEIWITQSFLNRDGRRGGKREGRSGSGKGGSIRMNMQNTQCTDLSNLLYIMGGSGEGEMRARLRDKTGRIYNQPSWWLTTKYGRHWIKWKERDETVRISKIHNALISATYYSIWAALEKVKGETKQAESTINHHGDLPQNTDGTG